MVHKYEIIHDLSDITRSVLFRQGVPKIWDQSLLMSIVYSFT